jgi:hypothetical protein
MRACAKLLALALLGGLGSAGTAQSDGLGPLAAEVIADAAKSCAHSLSAAGVDERRLLADGWSEGKVTSKGKEVASPLRLFGRAGATLVLPATTGAPARNCVVMARIESLADYGKVAKATQTALSGRLVKTDKASLMWMLEGGRAAQMDATGSSSKPAVRIFVMHLSGKN